MPTTNTARLRRISLVLLVVIGLVAAGCGNSGSDGGDEAGGGSSTTASGGNVAVTGVPGVTDTEIRYAAFGTDSNNPLGTCVLTCYVQGIKAYFEYRNSEGGIYGRKLVLSKTLDDELSKNQQRAIEITSANDTFGAFSATQIASGFQDITKAGMPLYVWNIHPKETQDKAIFGNAGVICIVCTQRGIAEVVKLAGAKKVAFMGYGVSENSKVAAKAGADTIKKYSKDIGGAEVAYFNDNLEFGLGNGVGPEVTAMKKAGVDMVLASIDLNGEKTLAQEMQRQGMGDVPMYHPNTYDQAFVKNAGDLFEGDYVFVSFRPFEADAGGSALGTYKKWMEKTGAEITEVSMNGWINADEAYQGLKAAGPQFDRAKVIEATNTKLTHYTADGLIPPLDFSRQHEPATEADPATHGNDPDCTVLLKIHDGAMSVVGDKAKPWSCWPGDTRDWSEPEHMNFE
jgi:ABC-type branched-subunit amino acid transport system substrate-binding protein